MICLIIIFILVFVPSIYATRTSSRRERDFSHDPSTKEVDAQIDALRDRLYLDDDVNEEEDDIRDMTKYGITQHWYTLGALLQHKDLYFHPCGGCLQQESIDVFSECISQLERHLSRLQPYSVNNAHNTQLMNLIDSLKEMQYDAYHRRGIIYRTMGRPRPAIKDHEICLTFFPSDKRKASTLFNKASALMMLRDEDSLEQADADLEEALELNPVQQEVYPTLVELRKGMKDKSKDKENWSSLLQRMEDVIDSEPELDTTRSEIYWALYEVCEKLKDYDKAFTYLQTAHNIEWRKKKHLSNLDGMRLQHQQVVQVFTPEFWKSAYGLKNEKGPIFIIGMLRSGSTLLETLLDKHDSVHGIGWCLLP
jgi:tetratricopeptide (TPR) repeat protein